MTKPRKDAMIERCPGRWRLQVAVDSNLVSGERRRLSRTIDGSRTEETEALHRMVVEAGAGLYGGGRVTARELLDQLLASATLAATTRTDWMSGMERSRSLQPCSTTWVLPTSSATLFVDRVTRIGHRTTSSFLSRSGVDSRRGGLGVVLRVALNPPRRVWAGVRGNRCGRT
jgi:hypothetical protein